ncbi:hypothetical protein Bealeia1_01526 [Candidatus Bealeia paramacronuclearis]|uniref:Uncharacterized protein n=1 Tax=Candidatus Bealeia paramacronuclearis TaxID=1921001 RepID=A0ABZ2C555_9PROT|nr:hypothetical protein [Candidatus Bealeia paramacronuclearis]
MSHFKNIVLLFCVGILAVPNCYANKKTPKENSEQREVNNPPHVNLKPILPTLKRTKRFNYKWDAYPEETKVAFLKRIGLNPGP